MLMLRAALLPALLLAGPLGAQTVEISGSLAPITGGGESAIVLPMDIGVGYDRAIFSDRVVLGGVVTPTHFRQRSSGATWRVYRVQLHGLVRAHGGELFAEAGPTTNCYAGFDQAVFGDGPVCRLGGMAGGGVQLGPLEIGGRVSYWREAWTGLRDRPDCEARCDIHGAVVGGLRVAFRWH